MSEVNVTQGMQELLSRLPKTDTYGFHSKLNPEYTKEHIALSLTPGNLLLALHRAREAYELAVSYRNFKVGAAIVGLAFTPSRFQIMTGVNVKPDEESSMNVHAEQVALQKTRDRKFDAASMIVVVGNTQSDKQSGSEMPTLHPCGICRGVMFDDPLVDSDVSLIASALPDFSKIELYSLTSLRAFHESHDTSGMHEFTLPHLSLFDPAPEQTTPITIEDTPELLAEERIWSDTVGTFLLQRRIDILDSL
jgi:cytidine deaminase